MDAHLSGGGQLMGDLAAGIPGADHQHPTGRDIIGIAVPRAV